jgi:assimilatory nitrate reductase catalytic subunit
VDRLVKTHCCFCGQQCGIQLKVKDNKVVGFEPWEEFPFNQGKLCPKGVKRYMQDEHPDRLTSPLARAEGTGFTPPADACQSYRALLEGLAELEAALT